jgi:hypothetical protein
LSTNRRSITSSSNASRARRSEEISMFQKRSPALRRRISVMRGRSPQTGERIAMLQERSAVTRHRLHYDARVRPHGTGARRLDVEAMAGGVARGCRGVVIHIDSPHKGYSGDARRRSPGPPRRERRSGRKDVPRCCGAQRPSI